MCTCLCKYFTIYIMYFYMQKRGLLCRYLDVCMHEQLLTRVPGHFPKSPLHTIFSDPFRFLWQLDGRRRGGVSDPFVPRTTRSTNNHDFF